MTGLSLGAGLGLFTLLQSALRCVVGAVSLFLDGDWRHSECRRLIDLPQETLCLRIFEDMVRLGAIPCWRQVASGSEKGATERLCRL